MNKMNKMNKINVFNKINKILVVFFVISFIFSIGVSNVTFSRSMLEVTDEEADKEYNKKMEEQKKELEERINKSSNNYLKSLSVDNFKIYPEFDKQTENYEIKEELNVDTLNIKAEADDEKASVSGIGIVKLNSGENKIRIDITAENGTVRTYFIKAIKSTKKDLYLKTLKINEKSSTNNEIIKEISISPAFDSKVYNYSAIVENYVDSIVVDANTDLENTKISVTGNENLKVGANEIIITVTDNSNQKAIYKITVNKKEKSELLNGDNDINDVNKNKALLISGIVIILVLLFMIIKKRKHHKKH